MKFLTAGILLLLAFSFAGAQQQQKNWETFTSAEGGFSVLMPGKPDPSNVTVHTSKGLKESHGFSFLDDDLNNYFVAYSKFRETKDKEINYEEKFEKIEKGLLIASPGTVKSKSSLNLEDNPGRELTIERSEGSIRTYRFYFIGDYFYQMSVDIKRPADRDDRTARFLNSFKLTARKN